MLHEADLCSSVEDCVTCNGTEDPVAMTTCDQLNCSVVNIEMAEDNYMIAGTCVYSIVAIRSTDAKINQRMPLSVRHTLSILELHFHSEVHTCWLMYF